MPGERKSVEPMAAVVAPSRVSAKHAYGFLIREREVPRRPERLTYSPFAELLFCGAKMQQDAQKHRERDQLVCDSKGFGVTGKGRSVAYRLKHKIGSRWIAQVSLYQSSPCALQLRKLRIRLLV